jgi:hypothetical protein
MNKRISLLILGTFIFFGAQTLNAQRNFGFYNLQFLPQAHYLNPTFKSNNKVSLSIGTGTNSIGISHSGFTLNDILSPRSSDDSLVVNPGNAIKKMGTLNFLELNMHNELFGLGLQFKKRYFSLSVINRFNAQLAYPKDLFKLLFEGNGGDLLGKRANMDGLGLNLNSYIEYGFGYSQTVGKRLSFGSRVKVLSGIANVHTKKSVLGLTTDEDTYELILDGELDMRTSGFFGPNGLIENAGAVAVNGFSFDNVGVSTDIGTNFKLNDTWSFSSSVLDVGYIKWNKAVQNYTQDKIDYRFDGLDLQRMFNDSTYLESLQDSITNLFSVQENTESYTMALPTRVIMGANFQANKTFGLGVTYYSDWSVRTYRPTFMLTGSMKLRNWFFLNAHYMATNRSYANFGMAMCIKALGVQFYVASDNITSVLNPTNAKNVHLSFGLGFQFGKLKTDELEKKKKEDKDLDAPKAE